MNTTLVTAGVAALIIAVVGGGASVFGATVPVIPTLRRQVALGLVGVAFLVAAVLLRTDNGGDGGGTSRDAQAYQQLVVATCSDIAQGAGGQPPLNPGGTVDRDRYIQWVRGQVTTAEGTLNALWERPVPDELKNEQAAAHDDARAYLEKVSAGLNQLEQELPTRFSVLSPPPAIQQFSAALATPSARLNGSMSELAGQTCQTGQTGTSSG